MKLRPCIDIHNGKVKQIVGSTLSDDSSVAPKTNFETDTPPSFFADLYRKDQLDGGHIIMLGLGNEAAAKDALSAFVGGLQVGGGITPDNALQFLDSGATHVIVTSYVFNGGVVDWAKLKKIHDRVGKKRLVIDLSCKRKAGQYYIVTDRWQKFTDTVISRDTLVNLSSWCDEFLVHAVDIEGKQLGVDEELISQLAMWTPIPITYAGGVRSLADLNTVKTCGNNIVDVTVGSALDIFGGKLAYKEAVNWCRNHK